MGDFDAGEVARALLYARPPEWADKEAVSVEQKASAQRFTALAAVCEASPEEVSHQTTMPMRHSEHITNACPIIHVTCAPTDSRRNLIGWAPPIILDQTSEGTAYFFCPPTVLLELSSLWSSLYSKCLHGYCQ